MDFKALFNLVKKPKSPVEELERALSEIDIPAAEHKVEALEKQRRELLLSASNDEVAALDVKIRDANLDVERLAAMQETLTNRIAEMKSQGAEEARKNAYATAQRAYETGREILADYEKNAKAVASNIGKLAELDQMIAHANANLPDGAEALPTVEAKLRGLPPVSAREVKQEVLRTGWFFDGAFVPSGAITEDMVKHAKITGNSGTITDYSRSGAGTPIKVRKCKVVQYTTREAVPALGAHVLSGTVNLPGVWPGSPMIWGEGQSHSTGFAWENYNREAAIEQAAVATSNTGKPCDPRGEPSLRNDVKIIPLDDDEPSNG